MINAIKDGKTVTIQNQRNDYKRDHKKIFKIMDSLFGRKKQVFARIYLFILSCYYDKYLLR